MHRVVVPDEVFDRLTNSENLKRHSVDHLLDVFEDLDTNLDVIEAANDEASEEPLSQVINTLEGLGDTFNFLQNSGEESGLNKAVSRMAFQDLDDGGTEKPISDALGDLLVEIYEDRKHAEEEEEESPSVFSATVRRFGDLFRSLAAEGEEGDQVLTYVDVVIMAVILLAALTTFFVTYVLVAYCRRRLLERSYNTLTAASSASSGSVRDCSVSWISIDSNMHAVSERGDCGDIAAASRKVERAREKRRRMEQCVENMEKQVEAEERQSQASSEVYGWYGVSPAPAMVGMEGWYVTETEASTASASTLPSLPILSAAASPAPDTADQLPRVTSHVTPVEEQLIRVTRHDQMEELPRVSSHVTPDPVEELYANVRRTTVPVAEAWYLTEISSGVMV